MVAIDGPAGAGKSTVSKAVARRLGIPVMDTGSMYRAVTWKALEQGIDPADARRVAALARRIDLAWGPRGIEVDGRAVERQIRSPRVSGAVSAVSAHPAVRREMVRRQRELVRGRSAVVEGRDIGTVVCPAAPVKVFLTASPRERARRRLGDLRRAGISTTLAALAREIERRDRLDSTRTHSPLAAARDAVILDSTRLSAREVVEQIVALAREAGA